MSSPCAIEQTEHLRALLYPLGFFSSIAFGLRFLVQWYASEREGKSIVPPLFWKLSITGNSALLVHSFIQLQFPMYLLQSFHIVLGWRNLNFMSKSPVKLRTVLLLLAIAPILATGAYALQSLITPSSEFTWIRSPKNVDIPLWLHAIGTLGIAAFSLRFWVQWIEAERKSRSTLEKPFWLISLFGAFVGSTYFFIMQDWVNLIGPLVAIVPYSRNLVLLRKSTRPRPLPKAPCHHIVMVAGEMSGDEIGASIARELFKKDSSLRISGICGPKMRKSGVEEWVPVEKLQVMGLIDVLLKLPVIWKTLRCLLRKIVADTPQAVICIDQPSFSIRLAHRIRKAFRKRSQPPPLLIQVVAPSVWAYKPERALAIQKNFDAILLLYRFEEPYFQHLLPTVWIGHPGAENWAYSTQKSQGESKRVKHLVALYPGSRPSEIQRNLPFQLATIRSLRDMWEKSGNKAPLQYAIQLSGSLLPRDVEHISNTIAQSDLRENITLVPYEQRFDLMQRATCAIAKSGTVTLELGLHKTPHVVCYQIGLITQLWARYILKVPPKQRFALPNILLKKEVVPEYIVHNPSEREVALSLLSYIDGSQQPFPQETVDAMLSEIIPDGEQRPAERAANFIYEQIQERKDRIS